MAIPRRLIVVAASAAAAGVLWYVANRAQRQGGRSAVDDANDEKDKADADKKKAADSSAPADKNGEKSADKTAGGGDQKSATTAVDGAQKELSLFLSGDAWHDEIGWQALWEKDGVAAPDGWLRSAGRGVLVAERQKLTDHPALLAGCRRRWIVVCRYAGIDVGEAASLWNDA